MPICPNASITKMAKRYMKLERSYLTQNKEYDSYAHTMHTHQFLKTHYFEVCAYAQEEKSKNELRELKGKQSHL